MQIPSSLERPLLIAAALVATFLCGAAADQLWMSATLARTKAFALVPDTRPHVCTVTVDGIRDGRIEGTLTGSGRAFIGDVQVFPDKEGMFSVAADSFLTNRITVTIPPGTRFVASRKGSKYYPVSSSQGQKIAPQNRVYFKSADDAQAAGFHP